MKAKLAIACLAVSFAFDLAAAEVPASKEQASDKRLISIPDSIADERRRLFSWLPDDTETFVAARNLTPTRDEAATTSWLSRHLWILGPLPVELTELTLNRRIRWSVIGGRNYDVVSSFGTLRFEGASILVFEQPIENLTREIQNRIPADQLTKRTIAGHDAFVLPVSRAERESYVEDLPWEGQFVVPIDHQTIVAASSEPYLRQVLARMKDAKQTEAAAPDDVPEYLKYIDPNADLLIVRVVPQSVEYKHEPALAISAFVLTAGSRNSSTIRSTYWPVTGGDPHFIAMNVRQFSKLVEDRPMQRAVKIEQADGAVKLEVGSQLLNTEDILTIWMFLYMHQGIR